MIVTVYRQSLCTLLETGSVHLGSSVAVGLGFAITEREIEGAAGASSVETRPVTHAVILLIRMTASVGIVRNAIASIPPRLLESK